MQELTRLPGIGRKSANVIMRETGAVAEGITVDLHVVRVAPRLGMAKGADPGKIEEQLMHVVDKKTGARQGWLFPFLGNMQACSNLHRLPDENIL